MLWKEISHFLGGLKLKLSRKSDFSIGSASGWVGLCLNLPAGASILESLSPVSHFACLSAGGFHYGNL